jgi:hypothetical protein
VITEYEICTREGCDNVVKTQGLCSMHYMARWRAEQKMLEGEFSKMNSEFDNVADYICDGFTESGEDCKEPPVRWFAHDGDVQNARALCPYHVAKTLESLRMDIRRLEWK